jgi:hypothetical protein
VMTARVLLGWVDPTELEAGESDEDGAAASDADTDVAAPQEAGA